MDKNRKFKTVGGEITAFLSMILLLLLALVGTTLESARVNVGKSYADRSLQNALDSLFTEYCLPVWEDYHIFLLEGEETEELDKRYVKSVLQDYMEYALAPEKGSTAALEKTELLKGLDLLAMEIDKLEITDIVRAEEYDRELLLHEILEYSKYQVDELFVSDKKKLMEAMEEIDACKVVVEKQLEAEQKMAEANLEFLEFLSTVEGISVGKTGILTKRNGLLKTETYFVKKFCPAAITKENTGINHEVVWKSLQHRYCNPVSVLGELEAEAENVLSQLELVEAQAEAEKNESSGAEANTQAKAPDTTGGAVIVVNYSGLNRLRKNLLKEAKGVLKQIEKAQKLLMVIKAKQSVFEQEAKEFEAVYFEEEAKLSEESKKAFLEELKRLKNFAGLESDENTSMIAKILKMEDCLEHNKQLVEQLIGFANTSAGNSVESVRNYIVMLQGIKGSMKAYEIKNLQFNYDSLVIEKDLENPIEAFSKSYKNNLLELTVKEPELISKKVKKVQKRQVENKLVEMETLQNQVNEQIQQFLLGSYIEQHFKCYTDGYKTSDEQIDAQKEGQSEELKGKETEEKKTVLDYEQEYLLSGKLSDRENLEEAINKMVAARGLMNYIYLLTDKEKCDMAYATAAALVGYTCMEPLVQLTKNIILLVWATEEAVVDVGGLLQGKEVLIFKNKSAFQITYEELFRFNQNLIQSKISEMPETAKELAMDYQQYLQLFLLFSSKEEKLAGLAELIEDNIKLRYDNEFLLSNCIYGITAAGDFSLNEKFVSLPFVQQILSTGGKGFLIHSRQSYCY